MKQYKLDVIPLFLEALSLVYKHRRSLSMAAIPLIAVTFTAMFFNNFSSSSNLLSFTGIVFAILYAVTLVIAAVAAHRIFLLSDDKTQDPEPFKMDGSHLRFVGWWILLGINWLIVGLLYMLLLTPIMSLLKSAVENAPVVAPFIMMLLFAPVAVYICRISLVLPASAIGKTGLKFSDIWDISFDNGVRLALLVGFLPLCLNLLFGLLPTFDSIFHELLGGLLFLIAGAIGIATLSIGYRELTIIDEKRAQARFEIRKQREAREAQEAQQSQTND